MKKILCKFFYWNNLSYILEEFYNYNLIEVNKFVFIYKTLNNNYFLTSLYNGSFKELPSSILTVHKKTYTNTFYTINALNYIITESNNGIYVNDYELDWELYVNQFLLLTKNMKINRINFNFYEKIRI